MFNLYTQNNRVANAPSFVSASAAKKWIEANTHNFENGDICAIIDHTNLKCEFVELSLTMKMYELKGGTV